MKTTEIMAWGLVLSLLGCGGGAVADEESTTSTSADTAGADEAVSPTPSASEAVPYQPDPRLTVYVQGPDPVDPAHVRAENAYRFQVVMTNTGADPVSLAPTKVWFDVWRGDEQLECPGASKQTIDTPSELTAGDAFTFEADCVCDLPTPGEYEVRAYLSVATDDENLEIERHYVGRFVVTRR